MSISISELILDKFQIGLDIFTALSVIFAASQYIRSSRKEAEKQQKNEIAQAEKLRMQRISESGAKTLVTQLEKIAVGFNRIVTESSDADRELRRLIRKKSENESEERWLKRVEKWFSESEKQENLLKELGEYRECLSEQTDFIFAQRYILVPVLSAIAYEKNEQSLVNRLLETLDKSFDFHNEFVSASYLWRELFNLESLIKEYYQKYNKMPKIKEMDLDSIKDSSDNILEKNILKQLLSITADNDYNIYVDKMLITETELRKRHEGEELDKHLDRLWLYRIDSLLEIMIDHHKKAKLLNNIAVKVMSQIIRSRQAIKSILCLLSACYSIILLNKGHDVETIDSEIQRYNDLYELDTAVR
ncbi:hypothetical protein ACLSZN_03310 [Avibacterium avium]|uniref:hypothetical protein n=1 Tax=Avibacterium avium TaxID=751 RepID=UPI003BF7FDB9